ncbi:hypothetical protein D3C87_1839040 [compost metagenome]
MMNIALKANREKYSSSFFSRFPIRNIISAYKACSANTTATSCCIVTDSCVSLSIADSVPNFIDRAMPLWRGSL